MIQSFEDLWKAYTELCQGVLIKDIKNLKTADIIIGNTPDAWYNFALPKVKKPADFDLEEIKKILSPISAPASIYLWEKYVKAGFPRFLKQNGYELFGTDTWLVLDKKTETDLTVSVPMEQIGLSKFLDFEELTNEVFKEEGYDNRPYNKICRETLTGKRKSKVPGFSSEFFMIYEDGKPAAGGGLFLTKEVGYFHNDATYKQYRSKGYHTALIKERIKFCSDKGIKILYSIVEKDGQSFRNFKRCGFKPWQVCELFTLKS